MDPILGSTPVGMAPQSDGRAPPAPKLLDRVADALRLRGYTAVLRQSFVQWARRYILFHHKRHPLEMGTAEVERFLTHPAAEERVSESTQYQALNALVFLYQQVLGVPLGRLDHVRAPRRLRLPVVLSREEVRRV